MGKPSLAGAAYWSRVLKQRPKIVGLALAWGLFAALAANSLEPRYEAEVTLVVDAQGSRCDPVQGDSDWGSVCSIGRQDSMQTEVLLLRSRTMAESVTAKLGLWNNSEFDPRQIKPRPAWIQLDWIAGVSDFFAQAGSLPPPTEAQAQAAAAAAVGSRLKVESVPDSQVIRLSFTANDPALAARVANAFADAYVEMRSTTGLQPVSKGATRVTGDLATLRKRVETLEGRLKAYRETDRLAGRDGAPDITGKQVHLLSQRLAEARVRRDSLQELHNQIQQAGALSAGDLIAHPSLASNIALQSLKTAELQADRQVSELAKRYGPLHPRMISARSDLEAARAMLAAEMSNSLVTLDQDLDIARAQAEQLEGQLNALQTATRETGRGESDPRSLEQEIETARHLYDPFTGRFKDTDLDVGPDASVDMGRLPIHARVLDGAQVPRSPVEPNAMRMVGIVVLLGLVAGFALAMLSAFLDNTLKRPQDVENCLQMPILSALPRLSRRRRKKVRLDRMFTDQPGSQFAEAIRTLRTRVLLSSPDDSTGVVLLTSSTRGEGKTTVAVNLALALSQVDKVLLIDADIRRPSPEGLLAFRADTPGLSNLLAGTAEEGQCIHRVDGANIDILPAGTVPPDPLQLLSSRQFAQTLNRLRARYARIVIDSAPTQTVSDALMLSRACDAVVLVIRAEATPIPLIQTTLERLRQVGAPVVGGVLNEYENGQDGEAPQRPRFAGRRRDSLLG